MALRHARQIEEDKAHTLVYYPGGVPTSATIQVVAPSGTDIVSSTTATIDSVSTTVSSATAGDLTFAVASASGVSIGESYWLTTSASGRGYMVTVADLSGTTVTPAEPVRYDISSGTFKGIRLSYSLTTTHTATRYRDVRCVWRFTVDGVVVMRETWVDIVNSPLMLDVTEQDLERVDPAFGQLGADYLALRDRAMDDAVNHLRRRQLYPDLLMGQGREMMRDAVIYRTLQLRHIRDEELHDRYQRMYADVLADMVSADIWYDADDDLSRDTDTEAGGLDESIPPAYMKVG